MPKPTPSQWLMIGAVVLVVPIGLFTLLSKNTPTPAIAQQPDLIFQGAIDAEANRLRSEAGKDSECGTLPNATDNEKVHCFLTRLEGENREAIAKALFRQKALQAARRQ